MLAKPKRDDRGESLIELLVAVSVMATAIVALLGALATAIRVSEFHRHQTEAGVYVKAFAETLERKVAEAAANYKPCGSGPNPEGVYKSYYAQPAGYTLDADVRYWDPASKRFIQSCPSGGDNGVQLVSLTVATQGTPKVTERLDVTLRKPCRTGETPCR